MKQYKILGTLLLASGFFMVTTVVHADQQKGAAMYRVYNKNSGEHFYTKNAQEKANLLKLGWKDEGTGWFAPDAGTPVYRVYNKNSGDHHYTMSRGEKDSLVKIGWKYEGIGWYSADTNTKPLYRAYNPNARAGSHNYTTSQEEQTTLVNAGWKDEGVAWNGVATKEPVISGVPNHYTGVTIKKQKAKYDALKGITAKDFLGNVIEVTVTGTVDTETPGRYQIEYHAKDRLGQETVEYLTVTVEQINAPEISSKDGWTSVMDQSLTKFNLLEGISAVDGNGKPLKVTAIGTVNAQWPGEYEITYTATDEFGTTSSRTRSIHVHAYDNPKFYGAEDVSFVKNTVKTFDPRAGVTAKSGSGKVLEYTVSGTVDTTTRGIYNLKYTTMDEFGHQRTLTRTIFVNEN